ncbi:MAG: SCP-2 sterol transfer family protein [Deltaproteobacteria bacterium CG07_land_8_20_14_0_80_38_7]|nr:MAG: SCP-2 sterol transfer family protein [Deltaproteobacteria bacterium CG07_land_8_20_14_0_80_38_7]
MSDATVVMNKITEKVKNKPEILADVNAVIAVNLTGESGGRWVIDCNKKPAEVKLDETMKADMTLTMDAQDMVKMSEGELNPQMAFLSGKIKIDGSMSLAMKLGKLLS